MNQSRNSNNIHFIINKFTYPVSRVSSLEKSLILESIFGQLNNQTVFLVATYNLSPLSDQQALRRTPSLSNWKQESKYNERTTKVKSLLNRIS